MTKSTQNPNAARALDFSATVHRFSAMNDKERFMRKVKLSDNCWEWTGSITTVGYGQFWLNGRMIPAHHFLLDSPIQQGHEACHTCDNRRCVRPSHIFSGTRSDNMQDCKRKGRLRTQEGLAAMRGCDRTYHSGTANHQNKLSEAAALEILHAPQRHGIISELARKFNVSGCTVAHIRSGKRWKHLSRPKP